MRGKLFMEKKALLAGDDRVRYWTAAVGIF
jgi:hypothetical protein